MALIAGITLTARLARTSGQLSASVAPSSRLSQPPGAAARCGVCAADMHGPSGREGPRAVADTPGDGNLEGRVSNWRRRAFRAVLGEVHSIRTERSRQTSRTSPRPRRPGVSNCSRSQPCPQKKGDQGLRPWTPRRKGGKDLGAKRPRDPEPEVVEPVDGGDPVAARRAEAVLFVDTRNRHGRRGDCNRR